ncbi:Hypothetical protein (Fragment) [Durusdinium trenchii]|uniref:Uncharacterized protein n=1 Tax=Durusdinium trenchii TaxID=1381693 RepID=A0ABP0K8U9_9DINO
MARAFEPSNKWVSRMDFYTVSEVWQSLIAEIRSVPATNFITCRLNPTLDTLASIARQTAALSTLGNVPLLPATESATQLGDYVIQPFENSVTGAEEVDVQVDILSSNTVVTDKASESEGNGTRRLATTGSLADSLTAACYTVIQFQSKYIGQLVGDCVVFQPSSNLNNPVQVCLPVSSAIPVYPAFTTDCFVSSASNTYSVASVSVARSADGLSICASLSASGTYCPGRTLASVTPDTPSAPAGCSSVASISENVITEAAALKAAGPVSLPGLVKIGQSAADFAPKAVYISASGTEDKEDFAANAQQASTSGSGSGSGDSTTGGTESTSAITEPPGTGSSWAASQHHVSGMLAGGLLLALVN